MEERKLNILFISSWYPNKYRPLLGIFIKRHAAANALLGNVSVVFVSAGNKKEIEETTEDGIYTLRGYYKAPRIKITPFFQLVKFARYIIIWRKLIKIYINRKGKPDIINSNIVYPISILAAWLKFIWEVPYVITEHWTGYFPEYGRYKGFPIKAVSRMAVSRAGAVIAVSAKLSNTMQALGLKNNYTVISNVVDTDVFCLSKNTAAQRGYFHFIHVSALNDAQKNINGMIRVFNRFHALHPLTRFTIIWEEEIKEYLNDITEPYSEAGGIFLTGKREGKELAAMIQEADAFLLFSNYETQSIVLLEAMCCGVPVISSRSGGPEGFVTPVNGILIDRSNEAQLLQAMEEMMQNRSRYKAEDVRNSVLDMVGKEAIAKKFVNVYQEVLKAYDR